MQNALELRTFLAAHADANSFRSYVRQCFPRDGRSRHKINWAYHLAYREFAEDKRLNGEDYIVHFMCVALLMMYYGVRDADAIAAAILHDLIEDKPDWSFIRLAKATNPRVAYLVYWVTKTRPGLQTRQWHMYWFFWRLRRLAPELAKLIKIFDRFHNLLTSESLSCRKKLRIVSETVVYYQPVAELLSEKYRPVADLLEEVIKSIATDFDFKLCKP